MAKYHYRKHEMCTAIWYHCLHGAMCFKEAQWKYSVNMVHNLGTSFSSSKATLTLYNALLELLIIFLQCVKDTFIQSIFINIYPINIPFLCSEQVVYGPNLLKIKWPQTHNLNIILFYSTKA